MSLTLTETDLRRLELVHQALLRRGTPADARTWASEAAAALRALFRAPRSLLWLPGGEAVVHGLEPETLAGYHHFLEEPLRLERPAWPDPVIGEFVREREERGLVAYTHDVIDHVLGGRLADSQFHHDVEIPARVRDMHAVWLTAPASAGGGAAGLVLGYDRPGDSPFGEGGLDLLRSLVPSLWAGILGRFDARDPLPAPEAIRGRWGLTAREVETALLLAEGLSNRALARRLGIRPGTARSHTERVLAKLGLRSRKAVALRLIRGGAAG